MRFHGFSILFLLWVFLLILPSYSIANDEVLALRAFKRAISEDPLSKLSDWNTLTGDPCSWSGVTCSQNQVLSLKLSNSSLKGFLAPEIGMLSSLQELILDDNLLLGAIPKQVGKLKRLKVLDLSKNQLVGPIPSEIGGLTSIAKLNLQSNGLTGSLPPEFGNLVNLVELHLNRNKLSGLVPASKSTKYPFENRSAGLCQLTQLKVADFSYNFFTGNIHPCLKNLPRSSFQGNCFKDRGFVSQRSTSQCFSFNDPQVANDTTDSHIDGKQGKKKERKWLLVLEVVTGAVVAIFLITCAVITFKRCKPKSSVIRPWRRTTNWKDQITVSIDEELLKDVLKLSRQELEIACEDFSNIIGSSPDSKMYKGIMKDGPEVAVISLCISESHWTSYLEHYFKTKVADSARLNHENTANLLGYCKENDPFSRMLIFEYASNGTLYEHLHYGEGYQLSWIRRMKIAIGVARGLRYLHTELQPPFTMSELNSSAVYLTEDFSPKLVDFESWKTIQSKVKQDSGLVINGGSFHGIVDSIERRHMDVQGNIFAFGMLLLELISGRSPYSKDRGNLVDWAMERLHHPEKMSTLVDPELKNVKAEDLSVICDVVSLCIDPEPSKRPSMQIICAMLEDGIDTSITAVLNHQSSLAWAELALAS
ncbi:probable LRR receptor-like serine/threonine-protein kinase At1g63430 [Asparagus officinalis]|uniref:probable LRR receptor-like serine/threonine-protein kinase At1g63430 n=1 Tax=Asparagus officinalis TaxID=4686 RepID=UPI00098E664C|nr:probable LRR receptor-like serine/threonine-protein kinase At1g63430 [Asparagus officinalis]